MQNHSNYNYNVKLYTPPNPSKTSIIHINQHSILKHLLSRMKLFTLISNWVRRRPTWAVQTTPSPNWTHDVCSFSSKILSTFSAQRRNAPMLCRNHQMIFCPGHTDPLPLLFARQCWSIDLGWYSLRPSYAVYSRARHGKSIRHHPNRTYGMQLENYGFAIKMVQSRKFAAHNQVHKHFNFSSRLFNMLTLFLLMGRKCASTCMNLRKLTRSSVLSAKNACTIRSHSGFMANSGMRRKSSRDNVPQSVRSNDVNRE